MSFLLTAVFAMTLAAISCGRAATDDISAAVRRNADDTDSLAGLKASLSAEGRETVTELLGDSDPRIRAAAIYVTLSADSAAGYILSSRDRAACRSLWTLYTRTGDSSATDFAIALRSRFAGCTTAEAAQTVTGMFSAAETALAMEPGDIELANAVREIYKRNPDTLAVYESSLPSYILGNPGYARQTETTTNHNK